MFRFMGKTMNTPSRCILALASLALGGCASYYPYYGHDGVYYGKDYYPGYYDYYGYGYYPYYHSPYSSYYYSRRSYYYPYYGYYGYGGYWGRDDDDFDPGHDDEDAGEELRRITQPPVSLPPRSGDPRIIRRAKSRGGQAPAARDDGASSAGQALRRIDLDAINTPARRDFDPQPAPRQPVHTPRPQPRRHAPASPPKPRLRDVTSQRENRVRR